MNKWERCAYCDQTFHNVAGYEWHLAGAGGRCMKPSDMLAAGFTRETKGWAYEAASKQRYKKSKRRPPDLLI